MSCSCGGSNCYDIFCEVVAVTPEMASEWIDGHVNYRNLRARRVKQYAGLMERGEWRLSQPLIFDTTGKLVDGQHRLQALILTGKTIPFVVLRNLPCESIVCLDVNMARKPADVLGQFLTANAKEVQTIIRAIYLGGKFDSHTDPIFNCEVEKYYHMYKEGIDFCLSYLFPKENGKSISPIFGAFGRAAMYYKGHNKSRLVECAEIFMTERYKTDADETILALNKAIRNSPITRGSDHRAKVYCKAARAISAWIDGQQLTKLYYNGNDPFPIE